MPIKASDVQPYVPGTRGGFGRELFAAGKAILNKMAEEPTSGYTVKELKAHLVALALTEPAIKEDDAYTDTGKFLWVQEFKKAGVRREEPGVIKGTANTGETVFTITKYGLAKIGITAEVKPEAVISETPAVEQPSEPQKHKKHRH